MTTTQLFWDLYDPRTWEEVEKRAAEDAWAAIDEDWPDNIPGDLNWYAGMLSMKFMMEQSFSMPRWVFQDMEKAKSIYNAFRAYYHRAIYHALVQNVFERTRAEHRLPVPTSPPEYQARRSRPLVRGEDTDNWP
jgi:hypothetical protein